MYGVASLGIGAMPDKSVVVNVTVFMLCSLVLCFVLRGAVANNAISVAVSIPVAAVAISAANVFLSCCGGQWACGLTRKLG